MAGYSKTPLVKKLGIKPDHRIQFIDAPDDFDDTLGPVPEGVVVHRSMRGRGPYDVIVFFTKSQAKLRARFDKLRERMNPACGFWICWPKKSSGVKSDLTEDVIRRVALDAGLVDNKVCAVDETWSGLRVVIRVRDR